MSNIRVIQNASDVTIKDIEAANANKTLLYFPKLIESHVTWDEVFVHLNKQFSRKDNPYFDQEYDIPERATAENLVHIGGLEVRSNFHIISMQSLDEGLFKDTPTIIRVLEKIYGKPTNGGGGITSLMVNSSELIIHADMRPAFYWQGIGTVEWRRYDSQTDAEYESVEVTPGDVIYVPVGMFHSIKSKTPRFALSLQQEFL